MTKRFLSFNQAWRQIRLFLTAFFKNVTAKLALLAVAFNWGENMTAKRFVLAACKPQNDGKID